MIVVDDRKPVFRWARTHGDALVSWYEEYEPKVGTVVVCKNIDSERDESYVYRVVDIADGVLQPVTVADA